MQKEIVVSQTGYDFKLGHISALNTKLQDHNQSMNSMIMRNPNLPDQANKVAMSTLNKHKSALFIELDRNSSIMQSKISRTTNFMKKKQQQVDPELQKMFLERMKELYFLDTSVLTI